MPEDLILRHATPSDAGRLGELIFHSTNAWYRENLGHEVFQCASEDVRLFVEVYEAIDPGRCLVVEDQNTGALAGSCFVHPRPTHVSLGILNVDPAYFGRGIARRLLQAVTDQADALGLPTRLVSSAMNLDSYSLYTRAGFVPYAFFQDILIQPPDGEPEIDDPAAQPAQQRVRPGGRGDVAALVELEREYVGIERPGDLAYFVENALGCWRTRIVEGTAGAIDGYLASIDHPACRIIGPGVAVDEPTMIALIAALLTEHAGQPVLVIAPADRPALIAQLYRWGGRNCETHVAQCRPVPGTAVAAGVRGVFLPTFLPETA